MKKTEQRKKHKEKLKKKADKEKEKNYKEKQKRKKKDKTKNKKQNPWEIFLLFFFQKPNFLTFSFKKRNQLLPLHLLQVLN